jgi:hypothetical protein
LPLGSRPVCVAGAFSLSEQHLITAHQDKQGIHDRPVGRQRRWVALMGTGD